MPFSGVNEEPPIPMSVLTIEAVPTLSLCSCDLSKRLCKPLEIGQEKLWDSLRDSPGRSAPTVRTIDTGTRDRVPRLQILTSALICQLLT